MRAPISWDSYLQLPLHPGSTSSPECPNGTLAVNPISLLQQQGFLRPLMPPIQTHLFPDREMGAQMAAMLESGSIDGRG